MGAELIAPIAMWVAIAAVVLIVLGYAARRLKKSYVEEDREKRSKAGRAAREKQDEVFDEHRGSLRSRLAGLRKRSSGRKP